MTAGSDTEREREIARHEALGPPQPELDDLAHLAAEVGGTRVAVVDLIQTGGPKTVASVGFDFTTAGPGASMCHQILYLDQPVQVSDLSKDPRWRDNPFVTGERAAFRFYAAHQLRTPGGVVIGALSVLDDSPREVSAALGENLERVARRVVDLLELRVRTRELEEVVTDLTLTRNELQRSNEMLGMFAGQVAHDLRGPVTGLSISLGMLQHELQDTEADQVWLLDRALRSIQRMDQLIGDMLVFASVGGVPRHGDVDLMTLVGTVREDLAEELGGVTFLVADLPVVTGDPSHLRMVLQNLISNAVKFAGDELEPTIRISASVDGQGWSLEVADNGPGVPVEDRERLFGLLTRGDRRKPGIGLGLAVCRRLVDAHGGSISLEEAPEGGALVRVRVPLEAAEPDSGVSVPV